MNPCFIQLKFFKTKDWYVLVNVQNIKTIYKELEGGTTIKFNDGTSDRFDEDYDCVCKMIEDSLNWNTVV